MNGICRIGYNAATQEELINQEFRMCLQTTVLCSGTIESMSDAGQSLTTSGKVRVVLADDHKIFRASLRLYLEKAASAHIVAEADTGHEALEQARRHEPDVVLMDIDMPSLNGLDATARIISEVPRTKVIILSGYNEQTDVLNALRAGASGYLLKASDPAELKLALESVASGKTYLSPEISQYVINSALKQTAEVAQLRTMLTPRQREILQLITEGGSSKEIGFLLNLSSKTVDAHRAQIMAKLQIRDIPSLVHYAISVGLISRKSCGPTDPTKKTRSNESS